MGNSSYKTSSPSSTNYSSGRSDTGLGLLGESFPEIIRIDHVITLKFSDKWDRYLRKWIDKTVDQWIALSPQIAESFHVVAAGVGSYFFFLGVSKLVAAGNSGRAGSEDDAGKKTRIKAAKDKPKDSNTAAASSGKTKKKESKTTTSATQAKSSSSSKPASETNAATASETDKSSSEK